MKVYVLITAGNFGDLEAFGGVYSTPKAAMLASGYLEWEERVYSFNDERYWYHDSDEVYGDNAVIREVVVED